jgi:hypothetical protein
MTNKLQEMSEDVQHRIREVAYMMWDSAGRHQGMALEYWLAAEREVLATMQRAAERLMPLEVAKRVAGKGAKKAAEEAPTPEQPAPEPAAPAKMAPSRAKPKA